MSVSGTFRCLFIFWVFAGTASGIAVLGFDDASAASDPSKPCGHYIERGNTHNNRVVVRGVGGVPCRTAIRIVRNFRYHRDKWRQHGDGTLATTYWSRFGWRCSVALAGGGCRQGVKRQIHYVVRTVSPTTPSAKRRQCGSVDGTSITAYNLGCRRARRLWRGPIPEGWAGANIDVDGGLALIYRRRDQMSVNRAIGRHGITREKLGHIPLVVARVSYGE